MSIKVDCHDNNVYDVEKIFTNMLLEARNSEQGFATIKLFGSNFTLTGSRIIGSIEAAQIYIDKVISNSYLREKYPHMSGVQVRASKNRSRYHVYIPLEHVIELIDSSKYNDSTIDVEYVLLHELAHAARPAGRQHGSAFINVLLDIVSVVYGETHEYVLRGLFLENGLDLS